MQAVIGAARVRTWQRLTGSTYIRARSFGLAREIALSSKWETQTFGTVTHMAPGMLLSSSPWSLGAMDGSARACQGLLRVFAFVLSWCQGSCVLNLMDCWHIVCLMVTICILQ